MPIMSLETILKTLAEQQAQIKQLQEEKHQLELMLVNQQKILLTQELVGMLSHCPSESSTPIIASIARH